MGSIFSLPSEFLSSYTMYRKLLFVRNYPCPLTRLCTFDAVFVLRRYFPPTQFLLPPSSFKSRSDDVTAKIDEKKKSMNTLVEKINKLSVGRDEYEEARKQLLTVLTGYKDEKNELMTTKQHIIEKMQANKKEGGPLGFLRELFGFC